MYVLYYISFSKKKCSILHLKTIYSLLKRKIHLVYKVYSIMPLKKVFFFSLFHKINQHHSRFQLCSVLHIIANIYNFFIFLCVFPF